MTTTHLRSTCRRQRRGVLAAALAVAGAGTISALSGAGTAAAYPTPPPDYIVAADHAALSCGQPSVTSQLLLTETWADSHFDTHARASASGAGGPAQLLPSEWEIYGGDDNGNGTASPYDVGDALGALARLNCTNSRALAAAGHPTDPVSLIAARVGGRSQVDNPGVRTQAQQIWSQR